jgi:hypothetical protein
MMIGKYRNKESDKNKDKSSSRESEHIESLIVYRAKSCIDPIYPTNIEETLEDHHNPKYPTMNMIEDDQKCEVDKWKEEHNLSI